MNYYNEIKNKLIENENYSRIKDYSKEHYKVLTYYEIGKLLNEAGKHYGEKIIKQYSIRLTNELGKGYNITSLKRMRQFYLFIKKGAPLGHQLTWSHYRELIVIKDINEIKYYIDQIIQRNLTKRQLQEIIKDKEYERLPEETKNKLINKKNTEIVDFVKNPIVIKNNTKYENISEKILQQIILEDLPSFLKELGNGFCFIENEFKIKLGNRYNHIDLLLYNIEYNCYVVIELKITELKKEHIGQIEVYMNYIDNNLKKITQEKTIGIIICKKDNHFIMEYCSDPRILSREYLLDNKKIC